MKANAPEKIYAYIPEDDIEGTASREKGQPHQFVTTEYTRTDAFIEKVCEYMITHIPDMHTLGVSAKMDECIIEDFKNYMKGEEV